MATPQENIARFQEISNRGLQDRLPADKKAIFDEAVSRGLITQEGQESSFGDKLVGAGEAVAAIGSGLASTVAGGVGGGLAEIAQTGLEAAGQDELAASINQGGDIVRDTQQKHTFQPTTDEGKAQLQGLVEALNMPVAGVMALVDLISGSGLKSAVDTIERVKTVGGAKEAGERTFEATGSPLAATAAEVGATGAEILLGGKIAGRVGEGIEQAGKVTGEAATKAIDAISPAAKDAGTALAEFASDVSKFKTPGQKKIIAELQSGEINADLAKFKLEESGAIIDPTPMQIRLGADLPTKVTDKPAAAAVRQGFSGGFVDFFKKKATTTDRKLIAEMTNNSQRGKKDPEFEFDNRPADVPGRVLLEQVNAVKKINSIAGKRIGDAKEFLEGKTVNSAAIGDSFKKSLDGLKIKFNEDKTLDFSDSLISGLGGRKSAINDIWGKMVRNKNPDAMDLHELKQAIDESISYGKSVKGLGGKAEGALRELRSNIKTELERFTKYAEANKVYSDTINILDEMQRLAGKKTDLSSDSAAGSLGTLARRLTSNAQSRGPLREVVKQLSDVLDKHSGFGGPKRLEGKSEGRSNLKILLKYANELDKVVGTPAETSLGGVMEASLDFAKDATQAVTSPLTATLNVASKIAKKGVGISEDNAYAAIRELIQEKK